MARETKIEWADATAQATAGCSKVSDGCANCYAICFAHRHAANPAGTLMEDHEGLTRMTEHGLNWTGKVRLTLDKFMRQLADIKKPSRVFVNSLSDLFHEELSFEDIAQVYGVMFGYLQHDFLILTKRPERALAFRDWIQSRLCSSRRSGKLIARKAAHVAMGISLGVSIENQATADERIPLLLQIPAAVRFVSAEPLLGAVSFRWASWVGGWVNHNHLDGMKDIDWVIVGGENGNGARPMHPQWVRDIRDQCQEAEVPLFFKGWGAWADATLENTLLAGSRRYGYDGREVNIFGDSVSSKWWEKSELLSRVGKKKSGNLLDGKVWQEFPREHPSKRGES